MKIRSMRTDKLTDNQIDEQREMTELIVAVRNSVKGRLESY